ncbi:hypothetical protein D3C87_1271770 [compost metagenome]
MHLAFHGERRRQPVSHAAGAHRRAVIHRARPRGRVHQVQLADRRRVAEAAFRHGGGRAGPVGNLHPAHRRAAAPDGRIGVDIAHGQRRAGCVPVYPVAVATVAQAVLAADRREPGAGRARYARDHHHGHARDVAVFQGEGIVGRVLNNRRRGVLAFQRDVFAASRQAGSQSGDQTVALALVFAPAHAGVHGGFGNFQTAQGRVQGNGARSDRRRRAHGNRLHRRQHADAACHQHRRTRCGRRDRRGGRIKRVGKRGRQWANHPRRQRRVQQPSAPDCRGDHKNQCKEGTLP